MIQLPVQGLSAVERHGLAVLIDLSRLLPAPEGVASVRLDVVAGGLSGLPALDEDPAVDEGRLRVTHHTLEIIGAITGAVAEQTTKERDRLGRVPSVANPLVGAGKEGDPIISRYAARFRQAAIRAAGSRPFRTIAPWPEGKRWAAAITHDLDVVDLWPAFTAMRGLELLNKGEYAQFGRTLLAATASTFGDPVWEAVAGILATERAAGVNSSWYIICGTPTFASWKKGDVTYIPESKAARRILAAIAEGGHELGLHGSMVTAEDPHRFLEQAERLGGLAPTRGTGVRQHFLRMDPGPTQRGMIRAGFHYDATFGFADRNGFRVGVADIIPWFDAAGDTNTPLEVAPFCWMDRTQSKYQGVEDPAEWARVALETAARCREVEGLWSGIWHPNLSAPLGYPGAPEAFGALVKGLASDRTAWVAPLGQIVEWRKSRRTVAAVGVGAAGEIRAVARPGMGGIVLEDKDGTPREQVSA